MSSWWKKAHQLEKKHQRPSFKRNGEQTLLWWKVCSLVVCIKKCYCAAANLRVSDVGASLKVAKSPVCLSGVSELFRKNGRRLVLDGRQWCKAYCTICKRQLISLNLSLWCKCRLHSVMAVEKWHHPCTSCFHYGTQSATRLDFFPAKLKFELWHKGTLLPLRNPNRKRRCFPGSLSPR